MLNRDDAIEHFVVLFGRQTLDNLTRVADSDSVGSEVAVREVLIVKTFATTTTRSFERKNYAGHHHNIDFTRLDGSGRGWLHNAESANFDTLGNVIKIHNFTLDARHYHTPVFA